MTPLVGWPPGDRLRASGQQSACGGQCGARRHAPGDAGARRHLPLRRRRPRHRMAYPRPPPDRIRIPGGGGGGNGVGPFPPAAATGRVDSVGPAPSHDAQAGADGVGLLRPRHGPRVRRPGARAGGRPRDPRDDRVRSALADHQGGERRHRRRLLRRAGRPGARVARSRDAAVSADEHRAAGGRRDGLHRRPPPQRHRPGRVPVRGRIRPDPAKGLLGGHRDDVAPVCARRAGCCGPWPCWPSRAGPSSTWRPPSASPA